MKKFLSTLVLGVVMATGAFMTTAVVAGEKPQAPVDMLTETQSPLGFDETVEKIKANAKALGWKLPKKWQVDFQRNLKHVTGIDVGKNKVLKMCAPQAGAELLVHDEYKKLATMMPCTIAVYEKSDGKTYISTMNMRMLGGMYGGLVQQWVEELAPQMDAMMKLN